MTIRTATLDDLDAIAALHVASWRASYRGILPDAFLDGPVEEDRASHWFELLEESACERVTLVAEGEGGLDGFVSAARSSDDGFDAYIEHIHIRPDRKGAGLGRRLLAALVERLLVMGCRSAYLLVFDANSEAIAFYERLGGRTESFGMEDMAGAAIPRSRVSWRDLDRVVRAAPQPGRESSGRP